MAGQMKICIISPNFYEPTAYMISAYKTAVNLARIKGVRVVVITSRTKGSKGLEIVDGVKVYRIPTIYIREPVRSRRRVHDPAHDWPFQLLVHAASLHPSPEDTEKREA